MEILSQLQNLGLDLSVGMGLASGYVTVGAIGGAERMEYVAVGPAVNLAARLCERARSNSILVDQRTVSLIGKDTTFRFEQLESAELKGFSRPIPRWRQAMSPLSRRWQSTPRHSNPPPPPFPS